MERNERYLKYIELVKKEGAIIEELEKELNEHRQALTKHLAHLRVGLHRKQVRKISKYEYEII